MGRGEAKTYSKEFEEAWIAYGKPKNSSKSLAYTAFLKVCKNVPLDLLLEEIGCYNKWLYDQTQKQGREYPKCHMATWLNQGRHDSFEEEAKAAIALREARGGQPEPGLSDNAQTWETPAAFGWRPKDKFKMTLIKLDKDACFSAIYHNWIRLTIFKDEFPVQIVCPTEYHRREVERRFGKVLRHAFGQDVELTVAEKIP